MSKILALQAREILDSRGIPTVETTIWLDTKAWAVASVPSGTSTGKYEAVELRDGDPNRFAGLGVLKSVEIINSIIAPKLIGLDPTEQQAIDQLLINLDGTPNKSKLGANSILCVSQAVCEAGAIATNLNIFDYLIAKYQLVKPPLRLPIPTFNVINGGKHGSGNLDFQEFHIIPAASFAYHSALQLGEEIYQLLGKNLERRGAIHSVGAEGGYAPNLFTNKDAIDVLVDTINSSRYKLNRDVFLGMDVAASHFFTGNQYHIKDSAQDLNARALLDFYKQLVNEYHLLTLEDPLNEDDMENWAVATQELATITIVGDDLIATNKTRLLKCIELKAANGILVKPNQIGTISETVEVIIIAKKADWKVIVSHRSGETTDDFIADFAVGMGADYTKFGAPARGERVAKYNRLLKIEQIINSRQQ